MTAASMAGVVLHMRGRALSDLECDQGLDSMLSSRSLLSPLYVFLIAPLALGAACLRLSPEALAARPCG